MRLVLEPTPECLKNFLGPCSQEKVQNPTSLSLRFVSPPNKTVCSPVAVFILYSDLENWLQRSAFPSAVLSKWEVIRHRSIPAHLHCSGMKNNYNCIYNVPFAKGYKAPGIFYCKVNGTKFEL